MSFIGNRFFYFILALVFISSPFAFAVCKNNSIGISIHLMRSTYLQASTTTQNPIPFGMRDYVVIYKYRGALKGVLQKPKAIYLYNGSYEEMGNGDFQLEASSIYNGKFIQLSLYYNHEISFKEGLEGFFKDESGKQFDLVSLLGCTQGDVFPHIEDYWIF